MRPSPTSEADIKKAQELNNSRPLDVQKVSKFPEVKALIDNVYRKMNQDDPIGKRYKKKWRDNIRAILLDLYVAHMDDPSMYIAYSRDPKKFDQRSRYGKLFFSYRIVMKIIKYLEGHGLIENVKGYRNPANPAKSRQSRMRATPELIQLTVEKHRVRLPMILPSEDEEIIILHDENKHEIDYKDTEDTNRMRDNLKLINRVLEKNIILLDITDAEFEVLEQRMRGEREDTHGQKAGGTVDFSQKRLVRIFNNRSFRQGGRFYGGWWQNIPREYRPNIKINDKDVVEADYSGLHINMLYAMAGLPLPKDDHYEMDEYPGARDFLKKTLQAIINADSRVKAISAIQKAINFGQIKLPNGASSIGEVVDRFVEKHAPIKKYFYSGKGVELQFLDSQMAEKVMLRFVKMGYPILPLHDSFILHHGFEGELKAAMAAAFKEMFGCECRVDLKYNSITERQKLERQNRRDDDEDAEPRPISISEVLEDMKTSSRYHTLLAQYRKHLYPRRAAPSLNSQDGSRRADN